MIKVPAQKKFTIDKIVIQKFKMFLILWFQSKPQHVAAKRHTISEQA